MMRVKTLKYLAATRRSVFRVRRRVVWDGLAGRPWKRDTDGEEGKPETWGRWCEEYFVQHRTAVLASKSEARSALRPAGVVDQIEAREAWARYRSGAQDEDATSDYDAGRHRQVREIQVENVGENVGENVDRAIDNVLTQA